MSDIIHLLPDTIANQIAAGEVVQRPASVVKELLENAVDAGADSIQVCIKDAGRTLIQVIDNGKGMSVTDARMAFERHATSKIAKTEDLFALRTLGFRGEALASIASVAHVELKTRQPDQEMGVLLQLAGSVVENQEMIACNRGSIFSIKNLFFNVPARRKFLKSNETEFKNIVVEFEKVALVHPHLSFSLLHNDSEIYNLPASSLRQRIVHVFGKHLNQSLLPVQVDTSIVKISGFIGTPSSSKKRNAFQYFFVNGRYMRHPYFHKAVMLAFEPYIPAGEMPHYFIYLDVDPATIDVNIHPTKIDIKFEDEQAVFQIIAAAVKESIAKSASAPVLEFEDRGLIDIPVYDQARKPVEAPKISLQQNYNPFKNASAPAKREMPDWEKLFEQKEDRQEAGFIQPEPESSPSLFDTEAGAFQYKGKYLITPLKSGLFLIHQHRAHVRILFDEYLKRMNNRQGVSQQLLFPERIEFSAREATILPYLEEEMAFIGFDLANLGNNSYSINGIPSGMEKMDPVKCIREMVDKILDTGCEVREEVCETLALTLARQAAIPVGKMLSKEEIDDLVARLFALTSPNYTPDGLLIISIMSDDELEKRFK